MILRLTSVQKSLYDLLYREISKGNYNIPLPLHFPKKSANLLVKLVLGDHPELINFDNCCVYFENIGELKFLRLQPIFSPEELQVAQWRFDEAVNCC